MRFRHLPVTEITSFQQNCTEKEFTLSLFMTTLTLITVFHEKGRHLPPETQTIPECQIHVAYNPSLFVEYLVFQALQ